MRQLNEKIVFIHNCVFARPGKQPVRVHSHVLVKGQILQNQVITAGLPVPSRAARLLPEGSPRSRIPHQHRSLYFTDIDAKLQRVGGYQASERAGYHFIFDFLTLRRRIAAPVAGYPIRQRGKAAFPFQNIRSLLQHHLHVSPRFGKRYEAPVLLHQPHYHLGGHRR